MATISKDLTEAEGTLRVVIENLIDSQEGFQKAGEELKSENLKIFFLAESLRRAQFRGELENILHQEGVRDIKETGTAAGTFVRVWTKLKTALGAGEDTLLEAAEEGEHTVLDAYTVALNRDLPLPIRQVLATQASHVEISHDYIKAAREAHKS